ncbi:MAG: ABC transporter substrate-binding protein, partial [archaeon]
MNAGAIYSEKDIANGGSLVAGINGEPDALNPLTGLLQPARNIQSLIFRRLADINEDLLNFSPQMATHWEFSKDSLAIIFHLRTGVFWHDGVPFTAKDVVFTHEIEVNPKIFWDGSAFKAD